MTSSPSRRYAWNHTSEHHQLPATLATAASMSPVAVAVAAGGWSSYTLEGRLVTEFGVPTGGSQAIILRLTGFGS